MRADISHGLDVLRTNLYRSSPLWKPSSILVPFSHLGQDSLDPVPQQFLASYLPSLFPLVFLTSPPTYSAGSNHRYYTKIKRSYTLEDFAFALSDPRFVFSADSSFGLYKYNDLVFV